LWRVTCGCDALQAATAREFAAADGAGFTSKMSTLHVFAFANGACPVLFILMCVCVA
jgi:hypothetical protein